VVERRRRCLRIYDYKEVLGSEDEKERKGNIFAFWY